MIADVRALVAPLARARAVPVLAVVLPAVVLLASGCVVRVNSSAERRDAVTPQEARLAATPVRPFGTLREQAERQQRWLEHRLDSILPALMREHGVELWVIPMREYNEDPVFRALVSPTTFAARRRTIYLFHDRGAELGVERVALGGTSQGGLYDARTASAPPAGPAGGAARRAAELWGDEQWQLLRREIEQRNPRRIAINVSRTHAFTDGLSAGEHEAMREALGAELGSRLVPAELLPLDLLATRSADEAAFFGELNAHAWRLIETAFSRAVITPGVTTTQDVVWWFRQQLADHGLATWFQPSVSVQRRGWSDEQLGPNPVIQRGDLLWCDFGITALGLNTDTQHVGYVLLPGESVPPAGLQRALANANRLQDIVVAELRPGRSGNDILHAARARMTAEGLDGTVYSHPVGMHGHGAGPLIGRWDAQEGVPGRGDVLVRRNTWYAVELQVTTAVPEWDGQRVRIAQEEDVIIRPDGAVQWARGRQTTFHVVR